MPKETPFDRFRDFAQKVVSVPKAEVDRRMKEEKRKRRKVKG